MPLAAFLRRKPREAALLLLAAAPAVLAQSLQQRIEMLLSSSPGAQRAFCGVQVVSLDRNELLADAQSHRFFVPASNTKLFTTALALVRLGPEYRFQTIVVADGTLDPAGRLRGDLRLVGGGDPTLSNRAIPYTKGPRTGNPLQAIEELAEKVIAAGVRRIDGDVIGDDTAYIWAPYPEGWSLDDPVWEYGAPVSALTINDNAVLVQLRAEKTGRPVALSLSPSLEYYVIDNRIRADAVERAIRIERFAGSRQIRLWGSLPPGQVSELLVAIDDPALYAAHALADALRRRGVSVAGRAVARHRFANEVADLKTGDGRPAGGVELARRSSPPLIEILRIIDKVSQNLHAELVLREVGRARRRIGSREAGLEELYAFLTDAGVDRSEYRFEDGSGLSRLNLVTPSAVVKLLSYMHLSPHRDAWVSLLPVGGEDGTLSTRFTGMPGASRIRAKTGTLSHVSALSGYAESASRGPLAFAIICNNYNSPSSEIRDVIDKISILATE